MKTFITAAAIAFFSIGASVAHATGCHSACADGYTYSSESGSCVKKSVSS